MSRSGPAINHSGDDLLNVIKAALPGNLPADLRDDITQEMALAALAGEFSLPDLARVVPIYRRRINRLRADRFRFVSISAPIPGTDGLTYADALAG